MMVFWQFRLPVQRRSQAHSERSHGNVGSGCQTGASLLEIMVGVVLLSFLIIGGMRLSNTARHANMLGRDLGQTSALLNTFVERIRAVNIDSLRKNVEVRDTVASGAIVTYKVFDQTSAPPYKQPAGMVLLNAKLTWTRWGKGHMLETSTLLTNP
jgi:Tfp pilus assembly protein PilV